jgi:hypothetical protein
MHWRKQGLPRARQVSSAVALLARWCSVVGNLLESESPSIIRQILRFVTMRLYVVGNELNLWEIRENVRFWG